MKVEMYKRFFALKREGKKIGSFSLIERVILSAGAMLIFSVSFQIDQMPEGKIKLSILILILRNSSTTPEQFSI